MKLTPTGMQYKGFFKRVMHRHLAFLDVDEKQPVGVPALILILYPSQ